MQRLGVRRLGVLVVLVTAAIAGAQDTLIRTKVPLVVVSTAVSDRKGHSVAGLSASDFQVVDNGKSQDVRVDGSDSDSAPVALVLVIQAAGFSDPAVKKLHKTAAVISESVLGANGESAVVSFADEIRIMTDFTQDRDRLTEAIANFKTLPSSGSARMIDAVDRAIELLQSRNGARRSCILLISEDRDRGSKLRLTDVLSKLQRSDVLIFGLTYSAYLTAFTTRAGDYVVPDTAGSPGIAIIKELVHSAKKNAVSAFSAASGGRLLSFQTPSKLENDLFGIADDLHSRYFLSFTPEPSSTAAFHSLEIKVKGRPDLVVKARPGYWAVAEGREGDDRIK